jgi:hypothetical protein
MILLKIDVFIGWLEVHKRNKEAQMCLKGCFCMWKWVFFLPILMVFFSFILLIKLSI